MATIRKRGTKWQVQVRRAGLPDTSRSFLKKSDAQLWATQMEAQVDRQGLPTNWRSLQRTTLREITERYRDTIVPAKRSRVIETIILNAFLRHPVANMPLSELSAAHLASYRDERLTKVKPVTVNRELGLIQHALDIARKEWDLPLPSNPVAMVRKPKPGKGRERRLVTGEWDRLQVALRACRNPLFPLVVQLALATAMRRGELLSARWEHVSWTSRTLHLPMTKNGHARTIPLTEDALAALRELESLRVSSLLFSGLTAEAVKLAWKRTVRRAGIDDLHFHDLRHEAISRFFELGLTIPEVALISGHRDPRMLFRYTHLRAEDVASKLGMAAPAPLHAEPENCTTIAMGRA